MLCLDSLVLVLADLAQRHHRQPCRTCSALPLFGPKNVPRIVPRIQRR